MVPALLLAAVLWAPLQAAPAQDDAGCVGCHAGIEELHPWQHIGCTACHGGDGRASDRDGAHVRPRVGWPKDERVRNLEYELEYARFRNPTDLRVVDQTCGSCHGALVEHLRLSLHGSTAGHLNDSLYETGVNATRRAVYAVFDLADDDVRSVHGLPSLRAIEALRPARGAERDGLSAHTHDLPRKACMQCHLYSEGVGLPGRLGQDGLYRGEGCAACHVSYAEDGRSASGDAVAERFEPGHPRRHELTAAPPTDTCVRCHIGDASIGNAFRGLAQLYPNMPAGPDVPGTTDRLLANQFFLQDPQRLPADLHHDAGMHCIDCHTLRDVMGDGDIYGAMEHAVAIECTSCHGSLDAVSNLRTERGLVVPNLERKGDLFLLRSKVTGDLHRVKQAVHVIDPDHPDYEASAAAAMTGEHGRLECYACHSGWNTNFFGFHFDRNEAFTQLDTITGLRTRGSVSTQERVFATLRQFVLGLNPEGRIAPYMVGFSSMGTVHGEDGALVVDQGLPRTAAGLSGMSLVHHQTHTTQRAARACVECHRSPATWGLGTGGDTGGSFALARGLVVVAGERGVETLLLDREDPGRSIFLARLPLGGAQRVVLDADPVTGRASTAFVALEAAGVMLVDVTNPAFPEPRSFVAAGDVRDLALAGDLLLVANGEGGLRLVDVADRDEPVLLADLATREAHALSVQWPRVFVADGPGGLLAVDVSTPARPRVVGQTRLLSPLVEQPDEALDVATLFQYGRPDGHSKRTPARLLAAVANGGHGLVLLDVTEVEQMRRLTDDTGSSLGDSRARTVELYGRYELGDTTGVSPTRERDLLALTVDTGELSRTLLIDVTDPRASRRANPRPTTTPLSGPLVVARSFNPPVLATRLLLPTAGGLSVVDVTDSEEPRELARLVALGDLSHVAVEAFAFDRMLDESGRVLKDVSHEGARFLDLAEIHRVLSVPSDALGGVSFPGERRQAIAARFEGAAVPGGDQQRSQPSLPTQPDPESETARRLRLGFGIGPEEPLARMLRHVDPLPWDKNGDRALSRGELERLLFDLLDVNDDGELGLLEWPRHPDADPAALDRNGDERLSRAEMDLSRETFALLDLDGDGQVREGEWPFAFLEDVPPVLLYTTAEALAAIVSSVGFAKRQPRIYTRIAGNLLTKPHDIPAERYEQLVGQARANPLLDLGGQLAAGDFLQRWDIDRDGRVEADEYGPLPLVAARCDLDGDGDIDDADRPRRRGR